MFGVKAGAAHHRTAHSRECCTLIFEQLGVHITMTIEKCLDGTELTIKMSGRLATDTAPHFEAVLRENLAGTTKVIFDLAELEYVSSSGLRVFLKTQKAMNKQGKMVIRNLNETVAEIFTVTGFSNTFTIE